MSDKLTAFDAVNGLTEMQYAELFKIEDNKDFTPEESAIGAVKMGGIFWSNKYKQLMFGKFEKQKVMDFNEFKQKLKNTVP